MMEPPLSLSTTCMRLYEKLVVLFHHHQCAHCEETDIAMHITLPPCPIEEAMLSHVKYCRAGMSCQIPNCRDSRIIVSHGLVCRMKDCPVALSLSNKCMEWSQKLLRQIESCSSCAEINGLEEEDARQLLFLLFHLQTCTKLHNQPNSVCGRPQCHAVTKLLGHSQSCADRPDCQYPWCESLQLLLRLGHTFRGQACLICQPLRAMLKRLYLWKRGPTTGLQNIQMSIMIPINLIPGTQSVPNTPNFDAAVLRGSFVRTRGSATQTWKKKSRRSWRSWKRCEGLWIRRHPYRKLECKSRPAQQQRRTGGNLPQIPTSL